MQASPLGSRSPSSGSYSSPIHPDVNRKREHPRSKESPAESPIHKKGRIILPAGDNSTTSTQPDNYNDMTRLISQHTYERMQKVLEGAIAVFAVARTSQGHVSGLEVGLGPARIQVGQGNNALDAAHQNAAPGLQDNLRECLIQETNKNGITPIKKGLLLRKRFGEDALKELNENQGNLKAITKIFDKIWPKSSRSVIEGSVCEPELCGATTLLPADYNRIVDKGLEDRVRRVMEGLYFSAYVGKLDPKTFTSVCYQIFKGHYRLTISKLQNRITNLEKYRRLLIRLNSAKPKDRPFLLKRIKAVQELLKQHRAGMPEANLAPIYIKIQELGKNLEQRSHSGEEKESQEAEENFIPHYVFKGIMNKIREEKKRFILLLDYSIAACVGIKDLDLNLINFAKESPLTISRRLISAADKPAVLITSPINKRVKRKRIASPQKTAAKVRRQLFPKNKNQGNSVSKKKANRANPEFDNL